MNKTRIEWCDFTANPIRYRDAAGKSVWACVKASEGCQNCYAGCRELAALKPLRQRLRMATLTPYVDEAELRAMLSPTRLPAGSKVFVGDMTDVFGPWVPFEMLDRVFAVFALRPDVVFQVLTKRPERMREYMMGEVEMRLPVPNSPTLMRPRSQRIWLEAQGVANNNRSKVDFPWSADWNWPLPNVWLGTSAEDQHWADVRIPELLATPATVRFVSAEPLLGPLRLEVARQSGVIYALTGERSVYRGPDGDEEPGNPYANGARIDWVIVGGESGPGARPCDVGWVRSIVSQCKAAGTKVFVKQLGAKPRGLPPLRMHRNGDHAWRAIETWPEDLRVREMPEVSR